MRSLKNIVAGILVLGFVVMPVSALALDEEKEENFRPDRCQFIRPPALIPPPGVKMERRIGNLCPFYEEGLGGKIYNTSPPTSSLYRTYSFSHLYFEIYGINQKEHDSLILSLMKEWDLRAGSYLADPGEYGEYFALIVPGNREWGRVSLLSRADENRYLLIKVRGETVYASEEGYTRITIFSNKELAKKVLHHIQNLFVLPPSSDF